MLLGILVCLAVIAIQQGAMPQAQAQASLRTPMQTEVRLMGCHKAYLNADCVWLPVLVNAQGVVLTSK